MTDYLSITKMLFEKKSYVIYGSKSQDTQLLWLQMKNWLDDNEIKWHIDGKIIRFEDEIGESAFLLRYYNG